MQRYQTTTNRRAILKRVPPLALAGLSAGASSLVAPAAAAQSWRLPPRLRSGDTVALVEPASPLDTPSRIDDIATTIRGMGLVPRLASNVGAVEGYLAGTDQQRASAINAMYADPAIRALFAVRGGWGSARILPLLDWDLIRANPKLLIGFSDITALHLAFAQRAGYPTLHAPNAGGRWTIDSWNSLWWIAFAGAGPVLDLRRSMGRPSPAFQVLRPGTVEGRLLGGNLSVLSALVGTPWMPDMAGAVLFLEDVGEAPYRIDRMMSQLALSGILKRVAGVIFGQCTHCSSGGGDSVTAADVLRHHLGGLGVPACIGANIGHVANQLSLPSGARVRLDAGEGSLAVLEAVVR